MNLADKLNKLMARMEISANELSMSTNIERSTLTRILNGSTTHPRFETIYSLAKYFNIGIQELQDHSFESDLTIQPSGAICMNKEIKDVLSNLMIRTGILSISLLHKYTGIPFSVLSEILNGKTEKPNMKTLQSLSTFFNVSVAQMLGIDEIPSYKIAEIHPQKNVLPILKLSQIESWISGELKIAESYTNLIRPVIGDRSFSIIISDDRFEPDFMRNNLLIIDTQEAPRNNDFIISKLSAKISISEFQKGDSAFFLREAGLSEYSKVDDFSILGVVVQQIISRRELNYGR